MRFTTRMTLLLGLVLAVFVVSMTWDWRAELRCRHLNFHRLQSFAQSRL